VTSNFAISAIWIAIVTQPVELQPLLYGNEPSVLDMQHAIIENPTRASGFQDRMWQQASVEASFPLLRAYLNTSVLFGSLPEGSESVRWWKRTLERDPIVAVKVFADADTRYIIWSVDQWPDELEIFLPAYRILLVKTLFEAYLAAVNKADEVQAEIEQFIPINQFPPEGLPPHSDPSWVKDPALRAEYEERLAEMRRRELVKADLHRLNNPIGYLKQFSGERLRYLYDGARPEEIQGLAQMLVKHHWAGSDLYLAIIKDWPQLANAVADLQSDEGPD